MSLANQVLQGFEAGRALRIDREKRTALQRAQELAQAGDFGGAQGTLMGQGLMDEAQTYGALGEQQEAQKQRAALGQAYKTGGWQGAAKAAGEAGNFDFAALAEKQFRESDAEGRELMKEKISFMGGMAGTLLDIKDPMQRQALVAQIAPSLGLDPNALDLSDAGLRIYQDASIGALNRLNLAMNEREFTANQEQQQLEAEQQQRKAEEDRQRWNAEFGLQRQKFNADQANAQEELSLKRKEANKPEPIDYGVADDLRKEINANQQVRGYRAIAVAADQMERLAGLKTPQADVALVFNYAKSLDPTSTVREGEFAMLASAGSLGRQMQALFTRAEKGTLPDQTRAEMLAAARQALAAAQAGADREIGRYRALAGQRGLNFERDVLGGQAFPGDQSVTPQQQNDLPAPPPGFEIVR
jgi:hypothetical protein